MVCFPESRFAEFLDKKAMDVVRFASLGTTEQGESGSPFRVDCPKPSGAIGFYHPARVIVQRNIGTHTMSHSPENCVRPLSFPRDDLAEWIKKLVPEPTPRPLVA